MVDERDAYDVLQVQPTAPWEVVRAAYRALARRHHPDGERPDAPRMVEINRAYEQLKTPDRRAAYDRKRRPLVAVGPGWAPGAPGSASPTASASTPSAGAPAAAGPLARRMMRRADDDAVVDFGRYEGWRIADVARHDPDYLRWLSRHSTGIRFRAAIARSLPSDTELPRRPSWAR